MQLRKHLTKSQNKVKILFKIPAFAFPTIAGSHLSTPEGWKAELAWVGGYVVRQFTCPKAVTHALVTYNLLHAAEETFNKIAK